MTSKVREPITYGNWRVPKSAGVSKMTAGETYLFLLVIVGLWLSWHFAPFWPKVAYIVATPPVLFSFLFHDVHGLSPLDKLKMRMMFMLAKRRKRNVFRGGMLAPGNRRGEARLPGVLGASRMFEGVDAYQRPFGVIKHADNTVAVVMSVSPVGSDLVDQDSVDASVALWGQWLADLGSEKGIVGASITVETVPDSGMRFRQEMERQASTEAPVAAQAILSSIIDEYGQGLAQVKTYGTLVFSVPEMGVRGDIQRAIQDIGIRLPGLSHALQATGVGAVHLMTAEEITRLVAVSYDPLLESAFEQATLTGEHVELAWEQAAPAGAVAEWDYYRHDSGVSRTWLVTAPPRSVVQSHVLRSILDVNREVARKRVTLLYRTVSAAEAPRKVEQDVKSAHKRAQSAVYSHRAQTDFKAAQNLAADEASGAGLVDFGIAITATSVDEDLSYVSSTIESLSAASKLQVRLAYGAQDSAFALTLPIGLRPQALRTGGSW